MTDKRIPTPPVTDSERMEERPARRIRKATAPMIEAGLTAYYASNRKSPLARDAIEAAINAALEVMP